MRVRLYPPVAEHGFGRRERGDVVRVSALQVPEVVEVAVREDDEAAILRTRVLARLLLADQWVLDLGLGLQHYERESALVKEQKVDEPPRRLLKVIAESVQVGLLDDNALFELDVGGLASLWKEAPAGRLQQLVDLHPRDCFVHPTTHMFPIGFDAWGYCSAEGVFVVGASSPHRSAFRMSSSRMRAPHPSPQRPPPQAQPQRDRTANDQHYADIPGEQQWNTEANNSPFKALQ